jgi:hypothetical protein
MSAAPVETLQATVRGVTIRQQSYHCGSGSSRYRGFSVEPEGLEVDLDPYAPPGLLLRINILSDPLTIRLALICVLNWKLLRTRLRASAISPD